MTRAGARFWFLTGGGYEPDFDDLWKSYRAAHPEERTICDCGATFPTMGNPSGKCPDCAGFGRPSGVVTLPERTESPSKPSEPDPLPAEPEEEKSAESVCGGHLVWSVVMRGYQCNYCFQHVPYQDAVDADYHCPHIA